MVPRYSCLHHSLPECSDRSWLAQAGTSESESSVFATLLRPPQAATPTWPARYHVVKRSCGQQRARRRPCPGPQQPRSRERWAGGSRRHPVEKKSHQYIVANRNGPVSASGRKTYSKGTSTPGATTVNLVEVGQLGEDGLVAERDVDETVVVRSPPALLP